MVNFFNKEEERQIIEAIRQAEKNTSGEIRVHLEEKVKGDVLDAAVKTFFKLGMQHTAESNGVLIFLVPKQKQFAIIGDRGINEKVPPGFWDEVKEKMKVHFQKGAYAKGVCEGVLLAGQKLKTYFPLKADDKNELTDEISFGKSHS